MLVLVIDDEKSIRETLAGVFADEGWDVITAAHGKEGLQKFVKFKPQLTLLDVWMPGWDGITTLQKLRDVSPDLPIVVMSGHGTIETAVRATKLGAFDFLEKPLSLDKLLPMLTQAQELAQRDQKHLEPASSSPPLIGECPAIQQIKKQIELVAPKNAWVLITGENGTGKEVVAAQIHEKSPRQKEPFVAVNCAAIPDELIESELFGHTKGAFTNALSNKKGKFELADQGTLFLDEIGDMSLKTQAKVLRILQEQSFERVGGTETLRVDVRVLAATNKNLKHEMMEGSFREDLFYRLNVIPFQLPPLRERGHDILLLARFFSQQIAAELNEKHKSFSDEAKNILLAHQWPGNVRELKNLMERLYIMVDRGEVKKEDLEDVLSEDSGFEQSQRFTLSPSANLKQAKIDFEKAFIVDKLEENQWNISKTAEAIGIERSSLHRKIRAFQIDPKEWKG